MHSKSPSIHGYVCPEQGSKFERYTKCMRLTAKSQLLLLLILRELRLKRLLADGRARNAQSRETKVSAYADEELVEAFRKHADAIGRSMSCCASELIEKELEERWLDAALSQTVNP